MVNISMSRLFSIISCAVAGRVIALGMVGVWAGGSFAQTYVAPFSSAEWKSVSGPFACSLEHKVPGYGSARLARKAGQAEVLELRGSAQSFSSGAIRVEAIPPAWRSDAAAANLGQAQANGAIVTIKGAQIRAITASLEQGTNVMFSGSNLRVGLEARNFSGAFAQYKNCLKQLIPYTFEQLSRTQITYTREAEELSPAAKAQLDKIVRYAKADPKVLGILVDAHSDKRAKPEDAEAASQLHAEWVTQYLIERGMAAETITTRWHGDKFPIANNQNKAGQAKNRRVTLRLENEATRKAMEKKISAAKEAETKAAAEQSAKKDEAGDTPAIGVSELEELAEQQDLLNSQQSSSLPSN